MKQGRQILRKDRENAKRVTENSSVLCGLCAFAVLICLLLLGGCSKRGQPEPPTVSLTAVDPSLARTIETSRVAVVSAPKSAEAWGKLGQALHAAEFLTEARSCYVRASELDPKSPRWLYLLGLLELADQPEIAIQHLGDAAKLSSGGTNSPQLALARALIERGRLDEAAPQLQELLRMHPDHAAARVELARVKMSSLDLNGALALIQPALTNPYTARAATLLLSQIEQRQGDTNSAAQLSRRAASMPRPFDWPDPYLREVQSLRADRQRLADQINGLLQQQRTKEAEALLGRLLTAFPDEPEGLLLLGRLRYLEKNCPEAEQAFRRHLTIQPSSLNGLIQLALSLLCQQRWNDATAVLEQAIALKPDFAQAHSNLGYARSRAGDSAGAIRAFRDALRCNPGDVSFHISLAEELSRGGQSAEAIQQLDRAMALNPNDPRIRQLRDRLR